MRRPHRSLLDSVAVENMAFADSVEEEATIDNDKRAYNMLLKSGLNEDQIKNIYGHVCDPDATELEPKKTQGTILNLYDKSFGMSEHPDQTTTAP